MGKSIQIVLSTKDKQALQKLSRSETTDARIRMRSEIILRSAAGQRGVEIARSLGIQAHIVAKWRHRFVDSGVDGLRDMPRPGAPRKLNGETESRILAVLDKKPPAGYSCWNGQLISKQLGDVTSGQVWTVMRRHGIDLERRHSWCVRTDPEFTSRAADIVGLYLNPPENAVILCMDEKPCIQATERAQGNLRFSDKKTFLGFSDRYARQGCTTLVAALVIATDQETQCTRKRKRRREFLEFMNELVATYSGRELHVVLDNLSTHRKKDEQWLSTHPDVHFHYTPTNVSWLNQVEIFFSILQRGAVEGSSLVPVEKLKDAIWKFIESYNEEAHPFEWKKICVKPEMLQKTHLH